MSAERTPLTLDDVRRVEANGRFHHPVLTVVQTERSQLERLGRGLDLTAPKPDQLTYIDEAYGFLADRLVQATPYTLDPLDIIGIGIGTAEIFSTLSLRYAFATMVIAAHAVQGAANPEWAQVPRRYFEDHQLPQWSLTDRAGLTHVSAQLDRVIGSIEAITTYLSNNGNGEDPLVAEVEENFRSGHTGFNTQILIALS